VGSIKLLHDLVWKTQLFERIHNINVQSFGRIYIQFPTMTQFSRLLLSKFMSIGFMLIS
jgi:hypothetical protein